MKVLVTCIPQAGHVTPLLPLLRQLVDGGDEVVVATGEDARDPIASTGAAFHPAGGGLGVWFERLNGRIRGTAGDGVPPGRIAYYFTPRLFGEIAADDMIDGVLDAGRALQPDLVLYDYLAFAGPLATRLLDAAAVHHLVGPRIPLDVLHLAADALSPLWRSFGHDIPADGGVYGDATIAVCPPSIEPAEVPHGDVLLLRPTDPPGRSASRPERPTVYVTLGTFSNVDSSIFRAALDGLAGEPVDVVVTVGRNNDPAALEPVPPNARVERFVPQAELLPSCTAVVHHAGSGTMFGAIAHGLPQVAIPQGADNFSNAVALERAGIAISLQPGEVTSESLRAAVHKVLDDPAYRSAAGRAAAEIAAMPGPADVAAELRRRFA